MRLETERLILRPFEPGDAEDLHAVHSDPSTYEFIGADAPRTVDETRARINSQVLRQTARAERVKVRAYDQNGNAFTLEAQGLLAVCIQHEMDHLQGKVFVEHLSQLKQQRIRAKLAKQLRKSA